MVASQNCGNGLTIAFVVGEFPSVTQTFVINQVADLIDRGVRVEIFAFARGDSKNVSARYTDYRMADRTHYLSPPQSKLLRILATAPKAMRVLCRNPRAFFRAFNIARYGRRAWTLRFFYWIHPFVGTNFDLIHCHFGDNANTFLTIKELLGSDVPMVTTFYGYDVSIPFATGSSDVYDRLKRTCDLFLVMSENMKQRVVAHGFPEEKIKVHPVSIDVDSYPYSERKCNDGAPVEIVAVGRLVEKKGFDDLLRALAIVRGRTARRFRATIIGEGGLDKQLRALATSLGLDSAVEFKNYMKIEDIIGLLPHKHILIAPSKTAANGDME